MRSLVLAFETPVPAHGGYRLRVLHLARQLAAESEVDVVALGEVGGADHEPFRLLGVPHHVSRRRALLTSWRRPYMAARVASPAAAELVRGGGWDVVQTESPWLVDEARAAGRPVVYDAHNVEWEIARTLAASDARPLHRLRWRWEAAKTVAAERRALGAVDAVLACSDVDAEDLRSLGARRVVVVPNGVDTTAVPHREPATGATLLYVGQLGYRPNEQAAIELIDDVLPIVRARAPQARLQIVGREPGDALRRRASAHVEVTGEVPDVLPYLHGARVLVVPLNAGSGTRLKILEAMSAGVPVVTTTIGAMGIDAVPGTHLLVGDRAEDLAAQALRIVEDDGLARSLSVEARRLVEARYDWRVAARPMVDLHHELAGARR